MRPKLAGINLTTGSSSRPILLAISLKPVEFAVSSSIPSRTTAMPRRPFHESMLSTEHEGHSIPSGPLHSVRAECSIITPLRIAVFVSSSCSRFSFAEATAALSVSYPRSLFIDRLPLTGAPTNCRQRYGACAGPGVHRGLRCSLRADRCRATRPLLQRRELKGGPSGRKTADKTSQRIIVERRQKTHNDTECSGRQHSVAVSLQID